MIAAFVFAAFFYGVAEYEHMTGWKWAIASVAVSVAVLQTIGLLIAVIPAQVGLFGVLWWQNVKRIEKLPEERAARADADRKLRQERVRAAQQEADRKRNA
ncbi:MAG TPA: hypothetical protein VGA20_00515 [Gemmatimonadales bacterium]